MDLNQLIIAGEVGWHKLQMASGQSFGSISVKLNLPKFQFNINDLGYDIQNPFIWLSISVSKDSTGAFKRSDERLLNALNDKTANYLLVSNAKISNWIRKGKDGAPDKLEYKCECSSGSVSFNNQSYGEINECIFQGKVTNYEPNGKMTLECSYMSPKTSEWKTRQIPVVSTLDYDPSCLNQKVLLFGKVCNVSPNGDTNIYIVTNNYIKL